MPLDLTPPETYTDVPRTVANPVAQADIAPDSGAYVSDDDGNTLTITDAWIEAITDSNDAVTVYGKGHPVARPNWFSLGLRRTADGDNGESRWKVNARIDESGFDPAAFKRIVLGFAVTDGSNEVESTLHVIPSGYSPVAPTPVADGLWMANGSNIRRVSFAGTVEQTYAVATRSVAASSTNDARTIAQDPGSRKIIVQTGSTTLKQVDPDTGAVADFWIEPNGKLIEGFACPGDGFLYARSDCGGAASFWKVAMDGTAELLYTDSSAFGFNAGDDGLLYFSDSGGNRIYSREAVQGAAPRAQVTHSTNFMYSTAHAGGRTFQTKSSGIFEIGARSQEIGNTSGDQRNLVYDGENQILFAKHSNSTTVNSIAIPDESAGSSWGQVIVSGGWFCLAFPQ